MSKAGSRPPYVASDATSLRINLTLLRGRDFEIFDEIYQLLEPVDPKWRAAKLRDYIRDLQRTRDAALSGGLVTASSAHEAGSAVPAPILLAAKGEGRPTPRHPEQRGPRASEPPASHDEASPAAARNGGGTSAAAGTGLDKSELAGIDMDLEYTARR